MSSKVLVCGGLPCEIRDTCTSLGRCSNSVWSVPCEDCAGKGFIFDGDDMEHNCDTCGTTGYVPSESR